MKYRLERINELMRRELSDLIMKEVKDPRIKGLVSITQVKVDQDLKNAKIYVSIYGVSKKEKEKVLAGLVSSSKFLHFKLSENIRLKIIPTLNFILDESIEKAFRIIEKLDKIKDQEKKHDQ
ncbi:MAG: 30S ribosome-binding factor RbfA [bacterium]|nr:30S ribosome-binding factor RbfA [bacterium]